MSILANSVTLVLSTIACGGCLLGFALSRRAVGGTYLDQVCSRRRTQEIVAKMTDPQVTAHLYVTVCLDTVFPVCYGLILAGSALRTSLLDGIWPVLPAACAVLFDYMENMTHFIALRTRKVPKIKPLLSILKWTFLVVALATPLFLVFAAE